MMGSHFVVRFSWPIKSTSTPLQLAQSPALLAMDISAAVDTLLVKPSLKTPYFSFYSNHQRAVEIVSRVQRYFLRDWPWPSAIAKSEYPKHDIDEMALVLCPNAPEDRAEVASAYLSVLFLYDDLLEEMTVVQVRIRHI